MPAPHSGQLGRSTSFGTEIGVTATIDVHRKKASMGKIKIRDYDRAMTVC
jgi:hypothetical protein